MPPKNKQQKQALPKGKAAKKKIVDPFTKKDWYDVKAPVGFLTREIGKTVVNKTTGTKISSDSLKGRVFVSNLADLNKDEELGYRKMSFRCEDVHGTKCLTQFCGMNLTNDKYRSLIRKWYTKIDTYTDVKTTDGYTLRVFALAFTSRVKNQRKKTSYAQTSQVTRIRTRMNGILKQEAGTRDLTRLVKEFQTESLSKILEAKCTTIYPLQAGHTYIRKVKVLKTPKFDPYKLLEAHGEQAVGQDLGKKA